MFLGFLNSMNRNFDICNMKILLVAATNLELNPVLEQCQNTGHQILPLPTGIGALLTCFHLTQSISQIQPDWVVQVGIGGCFNESIPIGTVTGIAAEYLGDLGVEENGHFSDVFDMGFLKHNQAPFITKGLPNPYWEKLHGNNLTLVNAVTVNEITTRKERIQNLVQKYDPILESMEGAALHLTCLKLNQPFLQIRAVSNWVGERNKSNWNIPLALRNLASNTHSLITSLK